MMQTIKDVAEMLAPFIGIALLFGAISVGCHAVQRVNRHMDAACVCAPAETEAKR